MQYICFFALKSVHSRVQMRRFLMVLLLTSLLVSCSDYGKIYKSKNATLKYNKALQLYLKKDFARAVPLFEQLRDIYGRSTDSLEQVYYYTAYCHYGMGDYELASMFFKDFTENFTSSTKSIECAYMAVYSDFLDVGTYELDQRNTNKIIGALQTFINYYPDTEYAQKCNEHIDQLRAKLMMKEYSHVIQYFNMGDFRATVHSARNTLKMYPDFEKKEELEYLMVKAQFRYAENSVEKKRPERMKEVIDHYNDYFYSNGNGGKHYKEVLELKNRAEKEIQQLKSTI
jgi:outer membrane protein assembly factor BamD